ncbi:Nramp-domain-containing protein [Metschnikowia bicuspidata var. bicuspidata NRRL YB-4993]|uniref:Nramp-domain-containing protein n=1 Tax=Metschnikowia bicuspidata var. bicuspidata NRRL YB-4993 TaxID=869754 RepID=A0A1A0HJ16_9ASCO|nr:Nramp-domain-containing protein [Metschnikowia bicuspidata var. bicuspidata NRRL YB-4993]OBA23877.1 Nramp-domain-containing protein [Metschnikowia bicuspidata var. bicuspidata NRRL YB-4993]
MDPGNYSTAVAAGSAYQYKLLFSIFLSNCLAIFLQVLSAKLGAVTGLDLAANCRENLSPRLNLFIYVLAEIAIIATDLAEVVGTAIALNILFNIPLFLGVIITVVDVLIVLMAYRPNGPLLFIRIFELFVSLLVLGTVVCFAVELFQVSKDPDFSVIEVLKGFLPNEKVIDTEEREGGNGLFLSLAILGATVMPHSLYLGSGLVQARLKDFDIKHGYYAPEKSPNSEPEHGTSADFSSEDHDRAVDNVALAHDADNDSEPNYRPSIHAIKDTMTYTIVELVVSLFTVALFVNATILIVAGATMGGSKKRDDDESDDDSDDDDEAGTSGDLFTIYQLLSTHISPSAGMVFALALLCSGQSAGVVCTLAGQMVLEGFLRWSFSPVVRRLITRALAIAPCLFVVLYAGREGLARTLNALQVVLSVLLPVVTAPLIWFTCSKSIMRVPVTVREGEDDIETIFDTDVPEGVTKNTTIQFRNQSQRFTATEPAIRLQDLRRAHPCAGWEDAPEDESHEQQNLILEHMAKSRSHSVSAPSMGVLRPEAERVPSENGDTDQGLLVMRGYTDMSNGTVMTVLAVLVWGFVTGLNMFLLGSFLLGYDVPL